LPNYNNNNNNNKKKEEKKKKLSYIDSYIPPFPTFLLSSDFLLPPIYDFPPSLPVAPRAMIYLPTELREVGLS
jgi:hypothetical protein